MWTLVLIYINYLIPYLVPDHLHICTQIHTNRYPSMKGRWHYIQTSFVELIPPFCVLISTFHSVSERSATTLRDTWWQHKLHLLSRCLGAYCLGTGSCQVRQSVNCNHMRLCSHLCNGTHSSFSLQQDSRNKQIWCGLSAAAQKTSSYRRPPSDARLCHMRQKSYSLRPFWIVDPQNCNKWSSDGCSKPPNLGISCCIPRDDWNITQ